MMMNCPKCGFSQPQDQYCARCGVDMLSYRPARKPFLSRLVSNTVFQIFSVIVVVAAVFVFAGQIRQRELANRISEIENAKNTQILSHKVADTAKSEFSSEAEVGSDDEAPESAPSALAENAAPPAASAAVPSSTSSSVVAGASEAAPASTPEATSARAASATAQDSTATAKPSTSVRARFASAQRVFLSDLVASADTRYPTSTGPVFFGTVPNLQEKVRAAQAEGRLKILDSSSQNMEAGEWVRLTSGQRDETAGQMIGFEIDILPSQLTESASSLQIVVRRFLRDPSLQIEEFSVPLPESFVIPRGAGVFVGGMLPRRQISEADRQFYESSRILQVLASDDYKMGVSDLLVFIEPR